MTEERYNKYDRIYLGTVVGNEDYQNMGRLDIHIPELGSPDSPIHASYLSPFAGTSSSKDIDTNNTQTFEGTQKSYGFWAVPPDLGVQVAVFFVNGDVSRAYWFGNPISQYMNHMIPNVPVGDSYQYDGQQVPVAEYNKADSSPSKHKGKRPYHKFHYESIRNQGLKNDKRRGFSQNGATSGVPSRVMGMLSPRGHFWSIEDTEGDEKIRMRTRNGVQVLLDDTEGFLYLNNAKGSCWIELCEDGKFLIYADDTIAFRSKNNIEFRADRDIIMDAGNAMKVRSGFNFQMDVKNATMKTSEKFIVDSASDVSLRTAKLDIETSGDANMLVNGALAIGSDDLNINSGGALMITSSAKIDIGAGANLTLSGQGNASLSGNGNAILAAGGNVMLGGGMTAMQMGASPIMAGAAKAASPKTITLDSLPTVSLNDINQPESDDDPEEVAVDVLVNVMPTHEPYPRKKDS